MGRNRVPKMNVKAMTQEQYREHRRQIDKRWRETNPDRAKFLARRRGLRYYHKNHEKVKAAMRARANARWAKMNKTERRDAKLRETLGITLAQWNQMFESQGRRCAICRTNGHDVIGKNPWHTDHCHTSQKVRGILCKYCNTALGLLSDNLKIISACMDYLIKHKTPQKKYRKTRELKVPRPRKYRRRIVEG